MFSVYKNYYNNFLGISIKKNEINVGDINFFTKLKHIKLDCNDKDNWIIAFDNNVERSQLEIFCNLFNDTLNSEVDISLSDLIRKYVDTFNILSKKDDYKELIGLLSELTFINILQNKGFDIIRCYQQNYDQFDFKVKNILLEIKHISKEKTIIISNTQLSKLNNDDCIIGVELSFDSKGIDLYQLIDKIRGFDKYQKDFISERIKNLDNELIKKTKINIQSTNFKIIERKFLPTIDKSFNNIVVEVSYKLFALSMNKNNEEFYKKMEIVFNG